MVGSAEHVSGPWRYERIEDASHWMQLDAPERVGDLLVEFLGSGARPRRARAQPRAARPPAAARAQRPRRSPRVLERMGGMQAQYAPSMYVGLWTRLAGFERDDLTRALERRTRRPGHAACARRSTSSRARDYWPFALAVREARRAWWLRSARSRTAARWPRRRAAARARWPTGRCAAPRSRRCRQGAPRAAIGLWLDLVRVPPSGTWERRRADLYGARRGLDRPAETTPTRPRSSTSCAATCAASGPRRAPDVANLAGLTAATSRGARRASSCGASEGEDGDELLDLPRAPLPDPDTPAPVRFLPTWDATLLVHARRTGSCPRSTGRAIFSTKTPQSVADVPRRRRRSPAPGATRTGEIELEPFGRLDAATRRALDDEAEGLPPSTPKRAAAIGLGHGAARRRSRGHGRHGTARSHYVESGPEDGIPVMLVHGNLSTGRFYEHLFGGAPERYRLLAPDMRGFGDTERVPIDATRGLRDWADDAHALVRGAGHRRARRTSSAGRPAAPRSPPTRSTARSRR